MAAPGRRTLSAAMDTHHEHLAPEPSPVRNTRVPTGRFAAFRNSIVAAVALTIGGHHDPSDVPLPRTEQNKTIEDAHAWNAPPGTSFIGLNVAVCLSDGSTVDAQLDRSTDGPFSIAVGAKRYRIEDTILIGLSASSAIDDIAIDVDGASALISSADYGTATVGKEQIEAAIAQLHLTCDPSPTVNAYVRLRLKEGTSVAAAHALYHTLPWTQSGTPTGEELIGIRCTRVDAAPTVVALRD